MAPASLAMNTPGLRTCGRGRPGPCPLPFSVESLLEAERMLGPEPAEPREERPPGATEPRAWFPPAARPSSPRKCPVGQSSAAGRARLAQALRARAGRALSLLT